MGCSPAAKVKNASGCRGSLVVGRLQVLSAHVVPKDKKFEVCCVQGHISPCLAISHSLSKLMPEQSWPCCQDKKKMQTIFSHTHLMLHTTTHTTLEAGYVLHCIFYASVSSSHTVSRTSRLENKGGDRGVAIFIPEHIQLWVVTVHLHYSTK